MPFFRIDEISLVVDGYVSAGSCYIGHNGGTKELKLPIESVHPVPIMSCIIKQLSLSILFGSIFQIDGLIKGLEIRIRKDRWVLSINSQDEEHSHDTFKHICKVYNIYKLIQINMDELPLRIIPSICLELDL